jgi:phosphatidylglycerol:prolipoprotein diacylglycerol transferase
MLPSLDLGPVVIPTAGLVIILGIWLALGAVEWAAGRLGQDRPAIYGLAATMVFAGVLAARLLFVGLHWPAYRHNLVGIVWPLTSGFEVGGGLVVGLAAGVLSGRARGLRPGVTLDALAPGIVVGLMVVSLADFLGGPGYGTVTAMPWGISQFGLRRHPVQLYEMVVGGLALLAWWRGLERPGWEGRLFWVALAVYSGGRLFVEGFRDDAWLTAGGYHVVQIVCLGLVAGSLWLLGRGTAQEEIEPQE